MQERGVSRSFGPAALLATVGLLTSTFAYGQAEIAGCPIFPPNNIWNTPVDHLPVHPRSARYIENNGPERSLHPDFGPRGAIPFNLVPEDQPLVPVRFTPGAAESDPGPYPIPPNPALEPGGDAHLLVLQQGKCKLFELYAAKPQPDGSWLAYSGALFDLRSNALRPAGWTSADAAGLPILPGLVRYDEVAGGEIRHALRLTVPRTRREYVWPARHFASRSDDPDLPAMGQRFRLRKDYDISGFPPEVQVILRALKKYGLILADNGSSWYITGAPDSRWNEETLATLKRVRGADLEAVDVSSLMVSPNSAMAGTPLLTGRTVVPFSPAPVFDLTAGTAQSITLAGDVAAATITGLSDGQIVSFLICQDSVGGRKFLWPSIVRGGMEVGLEPDTCSAQSFVSDGVNLYASSPGVANMPK